MFGIGGPDTINRVILQVNGSHTGAGTSTYYRTDILRFCFLFVLKSKPVTPVFHLSQTQQYLVSNKSHSYRRAFFPNF